MRSEDKKASLAGLPLLYNIVAGNMNAALFNQDIQGAKPDTKTLNHQNFVIIGDLHLRTTDPNKHPHRQYASRHRTDSGQDSRMDDIFTSESMCTEIAPSTEVLNTSGDAEHAPILAKILLTCVIFSSQVLTPLYCPKSPD